LKYFEASEDKDEEFYAGGGQYQGRHGLEHFPQLWCQNGSYSIYGQVRSGQSPVFAPFGQNGGRWTVVLHVGRFFSSMLADPQGFVQHRCKS
jgi:hypothetical protein